MVERRRKTVAHSSGSLDHHHENEVELEELGHWVCEADGEVNHEVEKHGHNKHDGQLGNQLRRRVNPHIIHAAVSFPHINRLFPLKHDNCRLKVQEHLQNGHEIDSSSHILAGYLPLKETSVAYRVEVGEVVELPEDGNHKEANDGSL